MSSFPISCVVSDMSLYCTRVRYVANVRRAWAFLNKPNVNFRADWFTNEDTEILNKNEDTAGRFGHSLRVIHIGLHKHSIDYTTRMFMGV